VIVLEGIGKRYDKVGIETVHALRDVSLHLTRGELLAIVGSSGSGKSTLLNVLGLLDRPSEGTYFIDGQDVTRLSSDEQAHFRNRRFGFVFQAFRLLPRATAIENVELPLLYSERKNIDGLAKTALESVGLGDRVAHRPAELSGGQQQRGGDGDGGVEGRRRDGQWRGGHDQRVDCLDGGGRRGDLHGDRNQHSRFSHQQRCGANRECRRSPDNYDSTLFTNCNR